MKNEQLNENLPLRESAVMAACKYYALYFPYGLKVAYKAGMHYGQSEISGMDLEGIKIKGLDMWFLYQYAKPILRPISDLEKDENFELYLELCEEVGMNRCDYLLQALKEKNYYAFDISKFDIIEEFLSKNHFDWKYDLISKGLAIDANTIDKISTGA